MTWHATDAFGDTYAATRSLLFPISIRRWVVLGIVVFFAGWSVGMMGSANVPSPGFIDISGTLPSPGIVFEFADLDFSVTEPLPVFVSSVVVVALALVALSVGLVFTILSSVMQFVFVHQLTERDIRIRGFFGRSIGPGIRLIAFWIGIALAIIALFFAFIFLTIITFGLFAIFLIFLIPVFFLGAIGLWVLFRFTIDFVVPIMIIEEVGVLSAWSELIPEVRTDWKNYGLYAVIRFFLDIGAGIVLAIGGALVLLVLAIPAIIIGLTLYSLLSIVSSSIAVVVAGFIVVCTLITVGVITTVVIGVPVHTYLRYYALFVLARISPQYDMLDNVKTAIDRDG